MQYVNIKIKNMLNATISYKLPVIKNYMQVS